MANSSSGTLLRTLREEIICPLCLNIFSDPRKLPCDHVYCKECLLELARRSNNTVSCPECRQSHNAPTESSCFSTAFHINRLINLYEQGLHETDSSSTEEPRVSINQAARSEEVQSACCSIHLSQDLSLYCETCEKLVCRDCILFSCAKSDHSYGYIKDVFDKHKSAFIDMLHPVEQLCMRGKDDIKAVNALEKQINEEEEKMVKEVDSAFNQLFDVLGKEKNILTRNVRSEFRNAQMQASQKKEATEDICTELGTLINKFSPASETESEANFLAQLKARRQAIEEVTKSALGLESPYSAKPPNLGLSMLGAMKFSTDCKESFYHFNKDDPLRCRFDRDIEWNNIPIQTATSVTFYVDNKTKTWWAPKVEAELYCLYTKEKQKISAAWDQGWQSCKLSIKPQRRGRHELRIKYNDSNISVSPVQIYVSIPNIRSLEPLVSDTFINPMGIKCIEDHVYVSELTSGLTELEARTLTRKTSLVMPTVWEVFIDTKNKTIYGTGFYDHMVRMMDNSLTVLKSIGGKGHSPAKFRGPNGIRCSKDEIFICDTGNDRIQVYDKELHFLREINDSRLKSPDDLDFDEDGNVYVTSQGNHTIVVFQPYGQFLRIIGKPGSDLGELKNPISVAVHNNLVYVTDHSNRRISIFTTAGEFVSVFGEGVLKGPECIAIDKDGFMYITDSRDKVYVF